MSHESASSADPEIEAVHERIETSRQELSETIEALVYKVDVPARTSDAINEGLATAKTAVSDGLETARGAAEIAAELASEQARLVTEQAKVVAAQASDATVAAASNASAAIASVPDRTRKRAYAGLGVIALIAVVLFFRRRRPKVGEIIEVDTLTIIDESPEVEKARQLLD